MTSKEFIQKIFKRLSKFWWLSILIGALVGAALYFYAKKQTVIYTSEAKLYPVNAKSDGGGSIAAILGGNSGGGMVSPDANISILELASSRRLKEEVALQKMPDFSAKTIAELLIESYNKYKKPSDPKIETPKTQQELMIIGGQLIGGNLNVSMSKGGLLVVRFSNANDKLLTPISNVIIDKLIEFYKDLKIKKATEDYEFTLRKLDSLDRVARIYDRRAIGINNRTRFGAGEKIEYKIIKENLSNSKTIAVGMKNNTINQREEALWRLQRINPIVEVLDQPLPPFEQKRSNPKIYAIIGFVAGMFLGLLILIADIVFKFIKSEINKAVYGPDEIEPDGSVVISKTPVEPTTTTTTNSGL